MSWKLENGLLISPSGKQLAITPGEAEIVRALAADKPVSTNIAERTILSRFRSKARRHGLEVPIISVYGKGYRLIEPVSVNDD